MATNLGTLVLKFVGDTTGLKKSFRDVDKMLGGSGAGGMAAAGPIGAGVAAGMLGFKAIETGISTAIELGKELAETMYDVAKWVAKTGAELERSEVAFQSLIGSTIEGKQVFADMLGLSLKVTHSLADMMPNAQLLLAYGVAGRDLVRVMGELSNVQAATGRNMSHLALAYGEVMTQGHLSARIMNQQLSRAGIGAATLAAAAGMSEQKLTAMVHAGTFTSEMFAAAFTKMTGETGMFGGAQERMLQTVSGQWGRLTKVIDLFGAQVGKALFEDLPVAKFLGQISDAITGIDFKSLAVQAERIGKELMPAVENIATFGLGVLNAGRQFAEALMPSAGDFGKTMASLTSDLLPALAEAFLQVIKIAAGLLDIMVKMSEAAFKVGVGMAVVGGVISLKEANAMYKAFDAAANAVERIGPALSKVDLDKAFAGARAGVSAFLDPLRRQKGGAGDVNPAKEEEKLAGEATKAYNKAFLQSMEKEMPGFSQGIEKLLADVLNPQSIMSKEEKFLQDARWIQGARGNAGLYDNDQLNRALLKSFMSTGAMGAMNIPTNNAIAGGSQAAYSALNEASQIARGGLDPARNVEAIWKNMEDIAAQQKKIQEDTLAELKRISEKGGIGVGGGK